MQSSSAEAPRAHAVAAAEPARRQLARLEPLSWWVLTGRINSDHRLLSGCPGLERVSRAAERSSSRPDVQSAAFQPDSSPEARKMSAHMLQSIFNGIDKHAGVGGQERAAPTIISVCVCVPTRVHILHITHICGFSEIRQMALNNKTFNTSSRWV